MNKNIIKNNGRLKKSPYLCKTNQLSDLDVLCLKKTGE